MINPEHTAEMQFPESTVNVDKFAWKPRLDFVSWKDRKLDKRVYFKRGKRRAKASSAPAKRKTVMTFYSPGYPQYRRTTRTSGSLKELHVQPTFRHLVSLPILGLITVDPVRQPTQ